MMEKEDIKEIGKRITDLNKEKEESEENCIPCKVNAAIGILIGAYCPVDSECEEIGHQVLEGKISIRELGEKLGADPEIIEEFEEQGVPVDDIQEWEIKEEEKEEPDFVKDVNSIYSEYLKKKGGEQ